MHSPALLLSLTTLFWAGNAIVGKLAVGQISPLELSFWRWVLAGVILAPFAWRAAIRDLPFYRQKFWPIFFLAGGIYVVLSAPEQTWRNWLVLFLVAVWALRLSIFLLLRNWGQPEDRRYREIRENNSPFFAAKSLYIVFGLQALIAWLVFIGLLPLLYQPAPFTVIDVIAVMIWIVGMLFELIADYQLYRFTRDPANRGKILDRGLWRYTRHPNYFGEFLIWWAFFVMAAASGYWWSLVSPMIITLLLFKVSGVGLMEKGMTERRPGYQQYVEQTSTFSRVCQESRIRGMTR